MDIKVYNLLKNGHHGPVLSKFLTLAEQAELHDIDLNIVFSNNYPFEERKRAFIYPKELDIKLDFKISFLKIVSREKLKHSDVLGAIMNLGITRDVIGDILISDEVYVIVASEILKYLVDNLLQVGKAKVKVEIINDLPSLDMNNYQSSSIIVTSMRLDSIINKSLNLSREKAQTLIQMRAVKINGNICLSNDYLCQENDIISINKFGRIIVRDVSRKTKKDKLVLNIERTK